MTEIKYVIEKGRSIPDYVTGVTDRNDDDWTRDGDGSIFTCHTDDGLGGKLDGPQVSRNWGPLTVTAVREPEPEPRAKVGDLISEGPIPADVVEGVVGKTTWTRTDAGWQRPVYPDTQYAGVHTCQTDRAVLSYGPLTVVAVREPEPAQAYPGGMECPVCGSAKPHNTHEPDDVTHYRIPGDASPLTLCGEDVWDESTSVTERAGSATCVGCRAAADEPKLPEPAALLDLVRQYGTECLAQGAAAMRGSAPDQFHAKQAAHALLDRIAALDLSTRSQAQQLQADLDTVKADRETTRSALQHLKDTVTRPAIKALGVQHNEDIVPAVERLKDRVGEQVLISQQAEQAANEWAGTASARGVEVERLSRLLKNQAANFAAANKSTTAPADPSVLSLPEVPPGTVALIGRVTGRRWDRDGDRNWRKPNDLPWSLASILADESVTVVMREPRTWPQLDGAEHGTKVRGASGSLYKFVRAFDTDRAMAHVGHVGDEFFGCWMSIGSLQEIDGPLTEVFEDEPGDTR